MAKKKQTVDSATTDYERALLQQQKAQAKEINDLYNDLINQITPLAATLTLPNGVFTLEKVPVLNSMIDQLITKLNQQINVIVENGIDGAWALSNDKNDIIADIRLDKSLIPANKQVTFYDPNLEALAQYKEREINGLGLSERVYNQSTVFKSELEAGIGLGISKGQSAQAMGADLKQYLQNPDMLFRRVRDAEGTLKLSKNAEAFNPGQGVYRSSTKNIQRLTRTETNMAYRNADNERYQNMPFILGYEVKTSGSHPKIDICDDMAGEYPVDFVFIGWHPQCLCFSVAVLMNDEQFNQYQQLVITGQDTAANVARIAKRVTDIPDSASQWIEKNSDRVAGYKNLPLWMQQNTSYLG